MEINELKEKLVLLFTDYELKEKTWIAQKSEMDKELGREFGLRAREIKNVLTMFDDTPISVGGGEKFTEQSDQTIPVNREQPKEVKKPVKPVKKVVKKPEVSKQVPQPLISKKEEPKTEPLNWQLEFNERASKEGLQIKSTYFSDCDTFGKMASHFTNLIGLYGGDTIKVDEIKEEYDLNKKYLMNKNAGN